MTSIKRRFEAAWARAQDEHSRLMRIYGWPAAVPVPEWTAYERLSAAAERIADEAGPLGSADRQAMIYS